ncbi:MAG: hypothetical protein KF835_03465 [Xanthobacteraceae bacterium]|nr:hypothetical protein [Xanthobacteraceae bacterium]
MADPRKPFPVKIEFNTLHSQFLQTYSSFELALEIAIKNLLRLTNDEVAVVCGGLGAGAKVHLLKSLISIQKDPTIKADSVTRAQNLASRNTWAHGIVLSSTSGQDNFFLLYREGKERFQVKGKPFTAEKMSEYATEFMKAYLEVLKDLGLTEADVQNYTQSLLRLAPDHLFLDTPPPEEKTS